MMFFIFIDLILFYLIFEIRLIPPFFKIIYLKIILNSLGQGIYVLYVLYNNIYIISFLLLVYIFNIYIYGIHGMNKFRSIINVGLIINIISEYNFTFWDF